MKPPRPADWLLRLLLPPGTAGDIIGDLGEEYSHFKLDELGAVRARLWYWRQLLWVLIRLGRIRMPGRRRLAVLARGVHGVRPSWWIGLAADLRFSGRRLAAAPGFFATVVATLTLGIGVTTAVFSAVNGVLLEPLPYERPGELVVVGGHLAGVGLDVPRASAPEYREYLASASTLNGLAATWPLQVTLTGGEAPVRVVAVATTANLFSLLGVSPATGRDFREEDLHGAGYVAILSHRAWERHFGRDFRILGRRVEFDDDEFTIVGVMPQDFTHPGETEVDPVEVWFLVDVSEGAPLDLRGAREFTLFGRLRPGISLRECRQEFGGLAVAQQSDHPGYYPPDRRWSVMVIPLLDEWVGAVRTTLLLLFGLVILVFLVVSTNVANLQLARGAARARDFAVRAAIGGSRSRITREFLLESSLLASIGCVGGVGVAFLGSSALRGFVSREFPRVGNVEMDGTVIAFAIGAALVSTLLFGLLPALHLSNVRPRQIVGGTDGYARRGRFLLRDSFVGAQTTLSLVLLVGAGLLFKSFDALGRVDLGFDPEQVYTLRTWLPVRNDVSIGRYLLSEQRTALFDEALEEMERLPGVSRAAVTSQRPLQGHFGVAIWVGSGVPEAEQEPLAAEYRIVSDSYFDIMGIRLLEGRGFTPADTYGAQPVVIVSRALAERHFPGVSPVGKTIGLGSGTGPGRKVVGVVEDVSHHLLDRGPSETVYGTFRQGVGLGMTFVLKTTIPPESLREAATAALQRIDPDLPAFSTATMKSVIVDARQQHRVLTILFGLFGLLTGLLAALGIYGVVSFAVTRRSREIGVRLVLGGARAGVLWMLLREGLRVGLLGADVGIVAAAGLSHFLTSALFEVGPLDPSVYSGAAALALSVVILASLIPALKAMRFDPAESIRVD